jgi:hypothetical protein
MKLQMTLLAVLAAGVWSTAPMAQGTSNPTGSYLDSPPMYSSGSQPWPSSGPTYSPNPNKAQNSDMRTQGGYGTYVIPGDTTYVYPASPIWVEPTASRRGIMTYGPTYSVDPMPGPGQNYTPNPNRVQNNGVPTQFNYSGADSFYYVVP